MINVSIARRYAQALLDVALQSSANLDEIGAALDAVAGALKQSAELRDVMENPSFTTATRQAVLARLLEATKAPLLLGNTLKLLVDRGRMMYVEAMARAFRDLVDTRVNRVRARVTSAIPLDPRAVETIQKSLAAVTQKQVLVEKVVDPKILGGVVAQVGSMTFDGSLATQLEGLRRTLRS